MTSQDYKHIFQEMSFEMMKDILSFTQSPRKAVPRLLEQIRELTGAKIVTIIKSADAFSKTNTLQYEIMGVNPERRKNFLDINFYSNLMELAIKNKKISVINESENNPYFKILQDRGIGLSVIMPIITDNIILGSFIILDMPTLFNLNLIIEGLENLSNIFSLTFRGSIFYMDMEEMVENRTRKLMESEEKLRNIIENSTNLFYTHSIDHIITYVSPQSFHFLGCSPEEALQDWKNFLTENPINDIGYKKTIRALETGERQSPYQLEIKRKDGKIIWGEVHEAPMINNGEVIGIVGSVSDITDRKIAETKLITSEKKYRNILQTTNDGFWLVDSSGKILDVNDAYCKMSGYSKEELLQMSVNDIEALEDYEKTKIHILKVMKTGHDRFETIHKKKDGEQFFVEISSSYLQVDDMQGFTVFIRDISERKSYDDALKKLSTEFASLSGEKFYDTISAYLSKKLNLEYIFVGEVVEDLSAVQIRGGYAKNHPIEKFKYNLENTPCNDVIGNSVCCYPQNIQQLYPNDKLLVDMGIEAYIGSPLFQKNGKTLGIMVGLSTKPILESEKIVNFFSIFIDRVTSEIIRERSNKDLLESELRFKALHNASFGGIVIHDKGLILECNAGLSKMTGYSYDELIGMNGLLLISDDTRQRVIDNINRGYEKIYEAIGIKKDGTRYPLRLEAREIPYQGKNVRVVEFRDISALKEAENERKKLEFQLQQSQKLEAIGTLTGGIAHDFNNLLTPVVGYADMMRYKMTPDNPFYEYVDEIINSSLKAKELIQQLLTFSRKNEKVTAPLNLIPVIKSSVKLIRSSLPVTVQILLDLPADISNINANNTQIHQIIMNLCINASHAMKQEEGVAKGNINIKLREVKIDKTSIKQFISLKPGNYIQLTVSDNGVGMNSEILSHIFEPFFTTKYEGQGTGMGLAVVHGIVKSYDGEIKVYSEPGNGTRFNIYFPVTDSISKQDYVLNESFDTNFTEKIFIVDDREYITNLLKNILTNYGFKLQISNNSIQALGHLKLNHMQYDMIITDLTMPDLTGIELVKEIKKINQDIPFIILTGHGDNLKKDELKLVDSVVHKPILINELLHEISRILN